MQDGKIGHQIFSKISKEANLKPSPEFEALKTVHALDGREVGGIQVFTGEKIEKMVIAEMSLAPGMSYTLISIKPTVQYNVPRFGANYMEMPEKIQFDVDLYPAVDLVLYPEYLDKYYENLKDIYASEKKASYFEWKLSDHSWMRAMTSPYYFMSGTNRENEDKVHTLIYVYADAWMIMWKEAGPVLEEASKEIQHRRDIALKTLLEREPERHLLENIFGKELTDKIGMAMT